MRSSNGHEKEGKWQDTFLRPAQLTADCQSSHFSKEGRGRHKNEKTL